MPEIPEIYCRAQEIHANLIDRTITGVEVLQPKCLNVDPEIFCSSLIGAQIQNARCHGKWIIVETTQGFLLLNLGMGGEILLTTRDQLPKKHRLILDLDGPEGQPQPCLSINFWWLGYAHYAPLGQLEKHEMTAKLGPNALDLSEDDLQNLFARQRSRLKTFLLDQTRIAGIGNFYIHDILYEARLHPLRKIDTLNEAEIAALARAIQNGLRPSLEKGGAFFELNLFGERGGFQMESVVVGYREGEACPLCRTTIEKIKTGSTTSYICPECQKL
jgi:formamidopyrimidine-DNA glycosylase